MSLGALVFNFRREKIKRNKIGGSVVVINFDIHTFTLFD